MARTFGIVFSVSHSRVSFLSSVRAAREGPRRVIDPIPSDECQLRIASRLFNRSGADRLTGLRRWIVQGSGRLGDTYKSSISHVGHLSDAPPNGATSRGMG